jgi:flagellar biosynthesis/type III secretory pathway M-ring protein FliF/YscJ
MGGDNLDAQLEPIAQVLILIILLIAVATISFLIINKVARRRREQSHNKLSASKRTKHTQVDLLGGSGARQAEPSPHRSVHQRRRRNSSQHAMIDILARPKGSPEGDPPDGNPHP